ncbi:hypothetical protein [Bifidobacterium castoris]|nr:hypothetical protein [Bifidobacterium castoris]
MDMTQDTMRTAGPLHGRRPIRTLDGAPTLMPPTTPEPLLRGNDPMATLEAAMADCHLIMQRMARECASTIDGAIASLGACAIDGWHGTACELYRERIRSVSTQARIVRAQAELAPAMLLGTGGAR